MDDPERHKNMSSHSSFAGRLPAGSRHPITITKNGVEHVRRLPSGKETRVLAVGLACSECFSGPNLYKILKPGLDYETRVLQDLMNGKDAAPLSIHTSSGVTEFLEDFLEALKPHLPWSADCDGHNNDWCVSLQLEGASAVWAGIDMLLQLRLLEQVGSDVEGSEPIKPRTKVAVAATSYHGPPSTSFGAASPIWHKHHQLLYPAPQIGVKTLDDDALFEQFSLFLQQHGSEIGVILFEPQWGSSQAGLPWPEDLLRRYIQLARYYGIKILCDEIMCGLGRHGHETLFLSQAWELDPDCVTFGKAIGAGVFPLSGAVIRQGRTLLGQNNASVMQSHTYSGSSARALMAATEVLKELPKFFTSIHKLGQQMKDIFQSLNEICDGLVHCQGQGLMWGGVFSHLGKCSDTNYRRSVLTSFKRNCIDAGIDPYHVPVGGFMVTPVIDIDANTIAHIGTRLGHALKKTMLEVEWEPVLKTTEKSETIYVTVSDTSETDSVISSCSSCNSNASDVSSGIESREAFTFIPSKMKAHSGLAAQMQSSPKMLRKRSSCATCSNTGCKRSRGFRNHSGEDVYLAQVL